MPIQNDMNSVQASRLQLLCFQDFIMASSFGIAEFRAAQSSTAISTAEYRPVEDPSKNNSLKHQYTPQLARLGLFSPLTQSAFLSVALKNMG